MEMEYIEGYYNNNTYSDDMLFMINSGDKSISKIKGQTLIAGEMNSQYIAFQIERYYDGIDLTKKEIAIMYITELGYGDRNKAINVKADSESIQFGWLVPPEALVHPGTLSFCIEFAADNYILKTIPTEIEVIDCMNGSDILPEPVEQAWYTETRKLCENTIEKLENAPRKILNINGNITPDDIEQGHYDVYGSGYLGNEANPTAIELHTGDILGRIDGDGWTTISVYCAIGAYTITDMGADFCDSYLVDYSYLLEVLKTKVPEIGAETFQKKLTSSNIGNGLKLVDNGRNHKIIIDSDIVAMKEDIRSSFKMFAVNDSESLDLLFTDIEAGFSNYSPLAVLFAEDFDGYNAGDILYIFDSGNGCIDDAYVIEATMFTAEDRKALSNIDTIMNGAAKLTLRQQNVQSISTANMSHITINDVSNANVNPVSKLTACFTFEDYNSISSIAFKINGANELIIANSSFTFPSNFKIYVEVEAGNNCTYVKATVSSSEGDKTFENISVNYNDNKRIDSFAVETDRLTEFKLDYLATRRI